MKISSMKESKSTFPNFQLNLLNSAIMKGLNDTQRDRFEVFRTTKIDSSKGYNKIKEVISFFERKHVKM